MVAVIALVLAVIALGGVYLSFTARRIDRLNSRVEAARAALDAQLVRRAAAAEALGLSGTSGGPLAERLAQAAAVAVHADGFDRRREDVENALSRALHAVLDSRGPDPLDELAVVCRKVVLARRFYNDAVRDTVTLRGRRLPRLLHLAGHAPVPAYFDIDDSAVPASSTETSAAERPG